MKLNKQKRKFLLVLPAVVVPFVCLVFYLLGGGGRGGKPAVAVMGLNTQLPKPKFDPRQAFLNKMQAYAQAEGDSLRREQYERQDPYRVKDTGVVKKKRVVASDQKADELLVQLDKLRKSIHQPAPNPPPVGGRGWPESHPMDMETRDIAVRDPKVEQLNALLDKVIRVQHPEEGHVVAAPVVRSMADEVVPADTDVNTISAVVPEGQTLTAGASLELRITDSVRVNGRVLPAGQLVYGMVNIQNDRMQVHIGTLRDERNLYTCDLQVYDLDGLAGIHIPGMMAREVAKQSTDQGVSSLNVLNMDPSLGAQAASAGIQTVKSFIGHKVRQVRVSVRAGYQVLLRPVRMSRVEHPNGYVDMDVEKRPPGFDPGGPIIERCRSDGMELSLRGIWLEDSCLWFGLEWVNHSPIPFVAAYARWYIRDRRKFKRTAIQEWPLTPVKAPDLEVVGDDSLRHGWSGFRPFVLGRDKELVVEIGEKGGGRVLRLVINDRELLHAKKYGKETEP